MMNSLIWVQKLKIVLNRMNSLIWVKNLKNSVKPDEQSNLGSKTEK